MSHYSKYTSMASKYTYICERGPSTLLATKRLAGVALRGESEKFSEGDTPWLLSDCKAHSPTALNPRRDIARSPKPRYQWIDQRNLCPPKIKKL